MTKSDKKNRRNQSRFEVLPNIRRAFELGSPIRSGRADSPSWPGQLSPTRRPDIREQSISKASKHSCLQNGRSPYGSAAGAIRHGYWGCRMALRLSDLPSSTRNSSSESRTQSGFPGGDAKCLMGFIFRPSKAIRARESPSRPLCFNACCNQIDEFLFVHTRSTTVAHFERLSKQGVCWIAPHVIDTCRAADNLAIRTS